METVNHPFFTMRELNGLQMAKSQTNPVQEKTSSAPSWETIVISGMAWPGALAFIPVVALCLFILTGFLQETTWVTVFGFILMLVLLTYLLCFIVIALSYKRFIIGYESLEFKIWWSRRFRIETNDVISITLGIVEGLTELTIKTEKESFTIVHSLHLTKKKIREIGSLLSRHPILGQIHQED